MDIVTSSLVCNKNFLRVLDGRCEDQGRPSVEFCGKQLPPNYISTSENLCLKFVTDIGMSAHGFIVNYTEVDNHRHLVTGIHILNVICIAMSSVVYIFQISSNNFHVFSIK